MALMQTNVFTPQQSLCLGLLQSSEFMSLMPNPDRLCNLKPEHLREDRTASKTSTQTYRRKSRSFKGYSKQNCGSDIFARWRSLRRLPRHIDRESVICSASQSELCVLSCTSRFRPEVLLFTARTRRIQHSLLAFTLPPRLHGIPFISANLQRLSSWPDDVSLSLDLVDRHSHPHRHRLGRLDLVENGSNPLPCSCCE